MHRKWKISPKIKKEIAPKLKGFPPIIAQLLSNRGLTTEKAAREFLDTNYLHFEDPQKLYDTDKAAAKIIEVARSHKKIFVHGDYDVDGISATSLLWEFLHKYLHASVMPYVPSRFSEGYGMTEASLENIKKKGGEVVITVDCGIRDHELIKRWRKKGLEFIVTDHHDFQRIKDEIILPREALAIVHPAYPGHSYPGGEIAGTTVVWKLVCQLADKLSLAIDKQEYLDLVALATICDIMPLASENRSIVKEGLRRLGQTKRIGLKRLITDAGIETESLETYHIGYIIGPRLNAAGRLAHAMDAVRLLVTNSYSQAREISEKLQLLNSRRQTIQEEIFLAAQEQIETRGIEQKLLFVWGEEWAEGVIGIVAGKLTETYNRPVLIATRKKDSYTGSARSISKFNIIEAINAQADLLVRFGGHEQAAGFTVTPEHIENFRDNLTKLANEILTDDDLTPEIKIDAEISLDDVTWDLIEWLEKFGPHGFGNPKPMVLARNLKVADVGAVGKQKQHLRMTILNENTGEYFKAIGFNLAGEAKLSIGDRVDLVFTPEVDTWNGDRRIQLNIRDVRLAAGN